MLMLLSLLHASLMLATPLPVSTHPLSWVQKPDSAIERLAEDQAKLAPQLRRLESLFEILEQRALEDGEGKRAELLAKARKQLIAAPGNNRGLAEQIERIASDLSEQRTGPALEAQHELLVLLENMLNELLQREMEQRQASALEDALNQAAELSQAAQRQRELLAMTAELLAKISDLSAEEIAELAAEQAELAEDIQALADGNPSPSAQQQALELAADAAEQAQSELEKAEQKARQSAQADAQQSIQEATEEQLSQAQEQQQQAAEQLEQAAQQAQAEADRMERQRHQEKLLNLMREAEALLERHLIVRNAMSDFNASNGNQRVARSSRVQLREMSKAEAALSRDSQVVLDEVDTGGADTVPYLMRSIVAEHKRLSEHLGPPSYRCRESQLALADNITSEWIEIIEAIRIEAEREREKLESQSGGSGQSSTPPLVHLSEELQLLKRLQENLTGRIHAFTARREILSAAGIELDEDDIDELDRLLQKQEELRQVYEAILARLEEASKPVPSDGDNDSPGEEELF